MNYRFPQIYFRSLRATLLRRGLDRAKAVLSASNHGDYDRMMLVSAEAVAMRRHAINSVLRERLGNTVSAGLFAGLRWHAEAGHQTEGATLLGTYEQELHPCFERLADFDTMVEVGSAEGYYTVGAAFRFPHLSCYGFEIDDATRMRADRLAVENGVADRVEHRGLFDAAAAASIPGERRFMLIDIEGDELTLVPAIPMEERRRWTFLVETHMREGKSTGPAMMELLKPTHEIQVIEQASRDTRPTGPLADFTELDRYLAVLEGRGADPWLFASPKPAA
jgi:hypothetical protein